MSKQYKALSFAFYNITETKISIPLLIYQKYYSNEVGIALKIMSSKPFVIF